jgi:hypothetical protein
MRFCAVIGIVMLATLMSMSTHDRWASDAAETGKGKLTSVLRPVASARQILSQEHTKKAVQR